MATQKATLINSANQKVVVESGSQSAKDYFSKGYQLMDSSGKYTPTAVPAVANVAPAASSASPAKTDIPAPSPAPAPAPTNQNQESPAPIVDKTSAFSNTPTIQSNTVMDEAAAKEYALSRGDSNWQQYVEGVGGKANPNYIGPTAFKKLQSRYTPYQIEKSTIRTKNGIYWNPSVDISSIPSADPGDEINKFAMDVTAAVNSGKSKTDVTEPKTGAEATETDITATENLSADSKNMNTALGIYNSIMNTPGMDDMKNEVNAAREKLDEYDQQMEELTDDIRKEVEGEAPESYINALAAVRGNKIMRLRRQAERDYNTAVANFNAEKEIKTNQINMMVKDVDNRYNRAFQSLQFQEQKAQNSKSWEAVKLNAKLSLPEGKSYTFSDGTVVEGLKENDNLATGTYTDSSNNVYYYAIDKKTGKEAFPQVFIGKAKAAGGGGYSISDQFNDYKAGEAMKQMEEINAGLADGTLAKGFDQNGDPFYYDPKAYSDAVTAFNAEVESRKHDWVPNNKLVPGSDEYKALEPSPYDYQKY